jgi:Flp pilus assembly protein TadG
VRRLIGELRRNEEGASAIFVAMTMTIVLIVAALVIDVGAATARNSQLQDAADAAALALAQQCYESPATTVLNGCDPVVRSSSASTAAEIAVATLNDGAAELVGAPVFDGNTVTVQLLSVQPALFSWAAGEGDTTVGASAVAQWNPAAVALPLAVNACSLPEPGTETVFIGTGAYDGVDTLLSSITSLLTGTSLPEYVDNILDCGTNVLAGGWLADADDECTFDPNVKTYVVSTLNKLVPVSACVPVIQTLIGKRVIVPVYDNATSTVVGSLLGDVTIVGYAEIVVTGYDFDGLAEIGPDDLVFPPGGPDPGCKSSVEDFLGVDVGIVGSLLDPLFDQLIPTLLACQGLQGQLVDDSLTAEEASAALIPYRLVA